MEQYKACLGYEGAYEVSDLGNVRSVARRDAAGVWRKLRYMGQHMNKDGYTRAMLTKHGKARMVSIHRLVYEAFHGPISPGLEINHLNGKRADNRLSNLECLSHADNVLYSRNVLRTCYVTRGGAKISETDVRSIRHLKDLGAKTRDLAEQFGICKSSVNNACNGKTWSHVS